jgi:hypothetical protein
MKTRCFNKRNASYVDYGGRGITVCRRWRESYENFLADMGRRPLGATLERRDVNGNYAPSNCIWADRTTQARNRRFVKLTASLAAKIRREPRGRWGDSRRVAEKFGVTIVQVKNVWYRDAWRDHEPP